MEWHLLVAINILMLCGFSLAAVLATREATHWPMALLNGAVLVFGAYALYFEWPNAGWWLLALYGPLILLPALLVHRSTAAQAQSDLDAAARYAKWASVLHPTKSWRQNAAAAAAGALPDTDQAVKALGAIADGLRPKQRTPIDIAIARRLQRWDDILALTTAENGEPVKGFLELHFRALGETGRVNDMVDVYARNKPLLAAASLRDSHLIILAFCGRTDAIQALSDDKKQIYHPEIMRYWLAIATLNKPGHYERGRAMLQQLVAGGQIEGTRAAAERHLRQTQQPDELSPTTLAQAVAIEQRSAMQQPLKRATLARSPVTLGLLVANTTMFAAEYWFGGIENPETLINLGAVWPWGDAWASEGWRLIAALFLHFGTAHFAINMLSLAVLGRLVEALAGWWRMLLIYVAGGIGSMAIVQALMSSERVEATFLVGASGAIMALFGGLAAHALLRWRQSRDVLDRRPLMILAAVVLVQTAVDLSIPQVSFAAHASGFLIGFVVSLITLRSRLSFH